MNDSFPILLAEDDANDVYLIQRALRSAGARTLLKVVSDGEQAVDYLQGQGKYSDRDSFPLPKLALLDIKMPRKTGLEVLEWLRNNPNDRLRCLPVIIMSSSSHQSDIDRAYALGVNAYLVKPHAFGELVHVFKTTAEFWSDVAAHPAI